MITGLDHLVVVVSDLEDATKVYQGTGFDVVAGGEHVGRGTSNALVAFEDGSYIELITFHRPNTSHRWWKYFRQGGGLVDACLGSTDLENDTAMLEELGVAFSEPATLKRQRPDRVVIEWQIAVPAPNDGYKFPFLIQDVTGRDARVRRPEGMQAAGIVAGVGLDVVVSEFPLGGEEAGSGHVQAVSDVADDCQTAEFGIPVTFIRPKKAGPAMNWLKARGPAVLRASMRISDGSTVDFSDDGTGPLITPGPGGC